MRKFIFIPQLDAAEVTPVLKKHRFKLPKNVEPRGVARWYHGNYYGYGNKASWFPLSSTGGIATKAFHGLTVTFPAPIDNKLIALLADKFARDKKAHKAELSEDRRKLRATKDQEAMECDWCGEKFTTDSYDLTDGRVFCSEMCRAQGEAGRRM